MNTKRIEKIEDAICFIANALEKGSWYGMNKAINEILNPSTPTNTVPNYEEIKEKLRNFKPTPDKVVQDTGEGWEEKLSKQLDVRPEDYQQLYDKLKHFVAQERILAKREERSEIFGGHPNRLPIENLVKKAQKEVIEDMIESISQNVTHGIIKDTLVHDIKEYAKTKGLE